MTTIPNRIRRRLLGAGAVAGPLFALPVFLGIPVAALLSARQSAKRYDRGWAWYPGASSGLMAMTFVLFAAAFGQAPRLAPWGGLIQRISVATGFGWLTALFARTRQNLAGQDPFSTSGQQTS